MKEIAVFIDGSIDDEAALATTIRIAGQFAANLTVLHHNQRQIIAADADRTLSGSTDNMSQLRAAALRAQAVFDKMAPALPSTQMVYVDLNTKKSLASLVLSSDLIVLKQSAENDGPDPAILNAVLWKIRSPVLALPLQPIDKDMSKAVFAWNGTPAAARALRAALPIIKLINKFVIVSYQGASIEDPDLLRYLANEGVSNFERRVCREAGLSGKACGLALSSECKSLGADLLIMGVFRPPLDRWLKVGREIQKICTSTAIPVFLHP